MDKHHSQCREAIHEGDTRTRWAWVEPAVWTKSMLKALERGVKGGKWYSLIDKVYDEDNLRSAWQQVATNDGAAGVDHVTTTDFARHLGTNLAKLHHELEQGTYEPQPVKRVWIPKPGRQEKRPLGIPTVRDRVVQTALRNVLEPIFENEFADHSYGFRPERGCKDALRRVSKLIENGHTFVVDADLKGYFDTIDHDVLMARLETKITDHRILDLVRAFLKQDVLDGAQNWLPEEGTPQGGVISPLLANVFLDPLDHHMAERGFEMVRYADDFVVLCATKEEAYAAHAEIEAWTEAVGLVLHPEKTAIRKEEEGFDFLGYRFERGLKLLSDKAKRRFL